MSPSDQVLDDTFPQPEPENSGEQNADYEVGPEGYEEVNDDAGAVG